jgi:release factor glutamine methyltransferase
MKSIGEILRLSAEYVQKKAGRPRHEVEGWIAHALGIRRLDLYLLFDRPLEEKELDAIRSGVGRLAIGEPLAYITGFAPFYGLEFAVTPDVLIPRPETETLVSVAKGFLSSFPSPGTIVDVCTGSGCVGLTLKTLFPTWHVVLSDISEKALAVAKDNAFRLNLDVEIIQGNLLSSFSGRTAEVIVSNPPYLSSSEWQTLDPSVRNFEPQLALDAGPNGTEMYQSLFHALRDHLFSKGLCAVEIGASQSEAVLSLAEPYGTPFLTQDLAGRDRVVAFVKN